MNKTLILQDIDITYLVKAEKNLTDALHHLETNQLKMGAIQAFELCHELCWKILKKVITKVSTVQPQYSRDIYREAAKVGLIENPELWFDFITLRNQTVHTYLDAVLDDVISQLPLFQKEAQQLLLNLQKLQ